jgi:ASC-1-like (ASCH) protein
MTKIHDLKIAPEHFASVQSGEKRAEFRINDRDYSRGDVLRLHEWESENGYTGKRVSVRVTDVTGLTAWVGNYVMLSFQRLVQDEPCGMTMLNWKELSEKGLVFRINHEILHPLGLAIGYETLNGVSGGAFVADDGEWQYSDELVAEAKKNGWLK